MNSRTRNDRIMERGAYVDLVLGIRPTMAVMLGSGRWKDVGRLVRETDRFRAAINRAAYGPRWSRRPDRSLLYGVAFIEKVETNPHLHCALCADDRTSEVLVVKGEEIWRKMVPGASYDARPILWPNKYARYITKELWSDASFERVEMIGRAGHDVRS